MGCGGRSPFSVCRPHPRYLGPKAGTTWPQTRILKVISLSIIIQKWVRDERTGFPGGHKRILHSWFPFATLTLRSWLTVHDASRYARFAQLLLTLGLGAPSLPHNKTMNPGTWNPRSYCRYGRVPRGRIYSPNIQAENPSFIPWRFLHSTFGSVP